MPAEAAEHDRDTGLASFLRGCPDPLSQAYDVALLDLDGVVYLGDAAVPGAPQALAKAADAGMRLAYVTNNSSRTPLGDRRPDRRFRGAGHRRRRGHLGPGRRDAAGRAAGARLGRARGGRERAARRGPRTGASGRSARRWSGPRPSSRGSRPASATRCCARARWPSRPGPGTWPRTRTRPCPPGAGGSPATARSARSSSTRPGSSRWSRASPSRRCTRRRWPGPAPGTRWWSGTGWTPTSRARSGPGPPACWCSPASPTRRMRCWPRRASAPPTWRPTWPACSPRTRPSPPEHGDLPLRRVDGAAPGRRFPAGLEGSGDPMDGLRALCAAAWSADHVTPEMIRPALAALPG